MFPAGKPNQWEPNKIRTRVRRKNRDQPRGPIGNSDHAIEGIAKEEDAGDETIYEEDLESDAGAVWPIEGGRITNWSCFFALMEYIFNSLGGSFHMPIMLIGQPVWTAEDQMRITRFFFEKFKCPAFALVDSAQAACYAFGVQTACVVDIGKDKADVTAVVDFLTHEQGRAIAVPDCGGESITKHLLDQLKSDGFNRDMSEQLKLSSICEMLPPGTPIPGPQKPATNATQSKTPAAVAPTGSSSTAAKSEVKQQTSPNTENLTEKAAPTDEENEGVIDVANIVTSGRMNEIIEKKEQEKVEKQTSKKKGANAGAEAPKAIKLKNSEREYNTFTYYDRAARDASKDASPNGTANASNQATSPTNLQSSQDTQANGTKEHIPTSPASDAATTSPKTTSPTSTSFQAPQNQGSSRYPFHRSVSVGTVRFQPFPPHFFPLLTSTIRRVIQSVPQTSSRQTLWDNLVVTGAGSRIRGFREALINALSTRFIISPSSATMFTSEIPSSFSTPAGTGANTPQPQAALPQYPSGSQLNLGGGRNSLLQAATTASASQFARPPNGTPGSMPGQQHLAPVPPYTGGNAMSGMPGQFPSSPAQIPRPTMGGMGGGSHAQTPTSVKMAKLPEYFPEWREPGSEGEAMFLGAQVASKVFFLTDVHVSVLL